MTRTMAAQDDDSSTNDEAEECVPLVDGSIVEKEDGWPADGEIGPGRQCSQGHWSLVTVFVLILIVAHTVDLRSDPPVLVPSDPLTNATDTVATLDWSNSTAPTNVSGVDTAIQEEVSIDNRNHNLPENTSLVDMKSTSGRSYKVSAMAAHQIRNYRTGQALIVNVHITHHGGTTVCGVIGRAKGTDGAPSFACMGVKKKDHVTIDNYPADLPWEAEGTEDKISLVRPFFHYISWEFSHAPKVPLAHTRWESPHLVSILVMREPISRLLAGDGLVARQWPDIHSRHGSEEHWWEYANHWHTNNYALAILAGDGCCDGEHTDRKYLEAAKELVRRQTFVLDIACLGEGIVAVADLLGIDIDHRALREVAASSHQHAPNSERIPYPKVYEYLLRRNQLDIELYQWSKSMSLVNCASLEP